MSRALTIPGCWEFTPDVFADDRGSFAQTYTESEFVEAVGHSLAVAQVNTSTSRRGTLRGLHYSVAPQGQAKYVTCAFGEILDLVVDLREGSSTFGVVDSLVLDARAK